MDAIAPIALLLSHQSGYLNHAVDTILPIYTMGVICLVLTLHRQYQPETSSAIAVAEDAYLVVFEREQLQAARFKEAQHRQEQQKAKEKEGENGRGQEGGKGAVLPQGSQSLDYSGVWKSVPSKNVNYEEFLSVQGVPYLKRKIATSTVVTHIIKQEGDTLHLEVQPLDMKTTFDIGGPPSTSYIGKKAFADRMTRDEEGSLVLVKTNEEDGMEITAVRSLKEGGKVLVMEQTVRNLKDGKETHAEQTFEKAD
ncbi:Calycin [Nannochloropsis gaditana]|uniref:Calycin n=1 Tax=Nannochloropsis gaditana TaxID=72520 RepID=W7TIT9_9STRA|nr:Calycin [Nannochloropsis gaditana]